MATFVYSPAIRVHVETENNGILDISDDISQWEVTRRSNAPSSFNFMLQNAQRKYDRVFRPSDRITVELKRIVWVRVFTGSLNSVPIFSAWPRALPLSATCSLKKLQFWPWDPSTTESQAMTVGFMNTINGTTTQGDAGMSSLIAEALVKVTNWDEKAIHIGAVPNAWFKWAQKTEIAIDAASNMESVLGPAQIGGASETSSVTLKPGQYGNTTLDQKQCTNAGIIYGTAKSLGATDAQIIMAFMTALDESGLRNLGNPNVPGSLALPHDGTGTDHASVGVFQQQVGPGFSWGSVQECQDVAHAAATFLKRLIPKTKGTIAPAAYGVTINRVQISGGDGSNYQAFIKEAQALVVACNNSAKATVGKADIGTVGTSKSPVDPTGSTPSGKTNYKGTGDQVAKVAFDLIHVKNNPPHIKYITPPPSFQATVDNPTSLDCSELVCWVLYHVQGTVWNCHDTHSQYPNLKIKNIPPNIAANIRGCLLYGTGHGNGIFPANGDPDHTGVAIGDGKTHVAAHTDNVPISQQVDQSDIKNRGLYWGALALNIDYTAAATNEASRKWLQDQLGVACSISTAKDLGTVVDPSVTGSYAGSDGGTTDPFAQLVSALTFNPSPNGDIFGGSRQLMNNQPFLPWIGNLTNSTMRAYCSAPNGDFMAWFPDYFNVWKTAAIMDVKLIELKDFTVEWSDQQIVTHEFVLGSILPTFDTASGAIVDGGTDSYAGIYAMLGTEGIATMDFPQIFETIYGKAASSDFTNGYLERFGARPNVEAMPNIMHGAQEFYMALWLFMKHWAEQFNASIPMTFMPELWPGMILRIQEYGFQAYVTEVTHRGSYGQSGGFATDAKIIAPAAIDENLRGSLFGMLNVFGNAKTKTKTN